MPKNGSKRKRLSDGTPAAKDKHQLFTSWAKSQGVEINGVAPESIPGRGIGLVTTKRLGEGDRVLFIPEKAMFKPDLRFLKREGLERASPQAQLAISTMVAFGATESRYEVWLDTWPRRDDFGQSMPMCWTESLQKLLPPPVHQPLARQLSDYRKDWTAVGEIGRRHGFSESDFKYFWMIVNSRSFHWKPPHSNAGSMVMCPFIDYINHGPTGSGCHVSQNAKGYEVHANRDYDAGEEIFATYGAHSNDKLLVHYGFICTSTPENPNQDDEIRLDQIIIPQLGIEICDQLQDVGYLGGYSLSPATNDVCFKTEVAVRAALLTSNEWEYFIANGEDLSVDSSSTVRSFVKGLLLNYRTKVAEALKEVKNGAADNSIAKETLQRRWTQILNTIDSF